jgi:hypothetical protein
VGATAYHEGGAAGIVQEDRGVLPHLQEWHLSGIGLALLQRLWRPALCLRGQCPHCCSLGPTQKGPGLGPE